MKGLKNSIMLIAMLCSVILIAGCDDKDGSVIFSGKVEVSPSIAKVGGVVTFSIGNSYSVGNITTNIGNSSTINGKEVVKAVIYYIDGNEIGQSSDKNSRYTLKYNVVGLTVGEHEVTARCESNFEDVKIVETVSSGTLIIEE